MRVPLLLALFGALALTACSDPPAAPPPTPPPAPAPAPMQPAPAPAPAPTDNVAIAAPTAGPAPTGSDFAPFLSWLQAVVASGDWDALATRTRSPLRTRGMDDSDPVVRFERARLPELMRAFYRQPDFRAEGTEAEALARLTAPPADAVTGRTARVGNMELVLVDGGWHVDLLYLEEASYAALRAR